MKILIVLFGVLSVGLCQMPGGLVDQPQSEYPKALQRVLEEMPSLAGNSNLHVLRVQTQVVAGLRTVITLKNGLQTCVMSIVDRPWLQVNNKDVSYHCTVRRQLVGGWSLVQDTNDLTVQKAIGMVVDRANQMSNSAYRMVPSRIIRVDKQLVRGMNYRMSILMGESTCMNSGSNMGLMAQRCPLKLNSGPASVYIDGTDDEQPHNGIPNLEHTAKTTQVNATVYKHLDDVMEITAFRLIQLPSKP